MTFDDKVMATTQWHIHTYMYMYMYTQFRTWEWEELHVATEKWLG